MAMALSRLEAAAGEPQTLTFLDVAYAGARAHVVGLTGAPGVGKSTLLSRLISDLSRAGPDGRRNRRRSFLGPQWRCSAR